MGIRKLMLATAGAALLSFAFTGTANAGLAASFTAPTGPQAVMRIDLPDDLDFMALTSLGAELDGTDITALLSLDGTDFTYVPVTPLAGGNHIMRLVRLSSDGVLEEVASWTFEIAAQENARALQPAMPPEEDMAKAEDWLRNGSFTFDTLTEGSMRIADKDLDDPPNRGIISGAGDANAEMQSGNWALRGNANYLLQTEHNLSVTGQTMDLGEYMMAADYAGGKYKGGVTLGHHDVGLNSLLMSSFYRRGASARLGLADERITAQTFALNAQSLTGAEKFYGAEDNNDRVEGITASVKPFSSSADSLKLTGIYLDGRGTDDGTGIAGTDIVSEGAGWGMIAEQGFGEGRIQMRGEYARSVFDRDGGTGAAQEDASDAYALTLEARPFKDLMIKDRSADLVLGASWQRIDTFFESLGNPGMAADRNSWTVYSNLYWDAIAAGLSAVHETNNVDGLSSVPEDRMRSLNGYLSWTFDKKENDWAWLGTPYLNLSGFIADTDRMETPFGYIGPGTSNVSQSVTFGGGTNYENWFWSLSHTISDYEDYTNTGNDTVSHLSGANAGWTVTPDLYLYSGLQFGVFRDEDAATDAFDTNFNFGGEAGLIPQVLNLNLDYNLNLGSGDSGSPDRHIINSELEWTLVQPQRNRPGMALAVRGGMEDINGTTGIQDETRYQVFTVLRVKAPFAFLY